MTTPNIGDLLRKAGVAEAGKTASAAPAATPAAAPVAAAPAKTAAPAVAPVTAAPAAPAAVDAKTAAASPVFRQTAKQAALADRGVLIADPVVADALYDQQANLQASKEAQVQAAKVAELQARGAIMQQGTMKEAVAQQLALSPRISNEERIYVAKLAAMCGTTSSEIFKRAGELKKIAELAAAEAGDGYVLDQLGRGAREEDGNIIQNAAGQAALQLHQSSASAGTRAPVPFGSPSDLGFTVPSTIPGNPGLNHGQPVDQGKAPPSV